MLCPACGTKSNGAALSAADGSIVSLIPTFSCRLCRRIHRSPASWSYTESALPIARKPGRTGPNEEAAGGITAAAGMVDEAGAADCDARWHENRDAWGRARSDPAQGTAECSFPTTMAMMLINFASFPRKRWTGGGTSSPPARATNPTHNNQLVEMLHRSRSVSRTRSRSNCLAISRISSSR